MYIEKVTLNGAAQAGPQIPHSELAKGGVLVFHLSDAPAQRA
jgi:putative alpha-1,2-mannosidase